MTEIIVPIAVCVVLPVLIVLIVTLGRRHRLEKRAEVMLKAIEKGVNVDASIFEEKKSSYPKINKTDRSMIERLISRLTAACVLIAIGLALIIVMLVNNDTGAELFFGVCPVTLGIALLISYLTGIKMFKQQQEMEIRLSGGENPTEVRKEGVSDDRLAGE